MKFGRIIITLLCVFILNPISATDFDSLETVWSNQSIDDEQRLEALDKIAWEKYLFRYPDSGFYYAQIQYDYAAMVGNKKQMANALNTQAVSHSMRGEYQLALATHEKSLAIRLEINDLYGIAKSYMNMGPAYSNSGDNINALDVYQKSLLISEPNNFVRLISTSLNNIGVIYLAQNNYSKALEYFSEGLKIAKENNNKRTEASAISNISLVYRSDGELDSALVYAINGLDIFEEIGDIKGAANALESIGALYYSKAKYDKAITFELKALKIREEINDRLGLASNMVKLGLAYNQKGKPKQGESWCKKGFEMAVSVGSLTNKKSACGCLYEVYEKKGAFQKSLDNYILYRQYDDSLKSQETIKKLEQMEFAKQMVRDSVLYEIERKESEVALEAKVHRRNSLQYTGISILLFIFVLWWYLARNLNLPNWIVELSLFVPFLVFFRFVTILLSPYTSELSNDDPFSQLLLSLVLAAFITPTHRFFEKRVRRRIFSKVQSNNGD